MKMIFPFLISVLCLCVSCEKDGFGVQEGSINFSSLKVGQKATFKRYQTSCENIKGDFEYTGDELILEVIEENGQMMFKETITETSPMWQGGFENPVTYKAEQQSDYLYIPERWNSLLFYFYDNDRIHLTPTHDVDLVQNACQLHQNSDPFIGNDIGYVKKFDIGPLKQRKKTAVSCEPYFELDGYLIYDQNTLFMSHIITGDLVNGWVLQ